jgi:hypothetical protein
MYVVRTDASGVLLYNASYGDVNANVSSYASSVVLTNDGGFAVAGTLNQYSPTSSEGFNVTPSVSNNVWLAKFAPQTFVSETSSKSTGSVLELAAWIGIPLLVATIAGVTFYKKKHQKSNGVA